MDGMTEPHELVTANLGKNELPTEGEWKRAMTDRRVMENAFAEHTPSPGSEMVHMAAKLRGERFIAVPDGAHTVAFLWKVGIDAPEPDLVLVN